MCFKQLAKRRAYIKQSSGRGLITAARSRWKRNELKALFHAHQRNQFIFFRSSIPSNINNIEFHPKLLIHRNFPNGSSQWLFSNLFFCVRTIITFHVTFSAVGERLMATSCDGEKIDRLDCGCTRLPISIIQI